MKKFPFVSICTPTYNRKIFIEQMIENYMNQTYPKKNMEWIIINDGDEEINDILKKYDIPNLRYISLKNRITLGEKRNMLNDLSKGEYILYMDDDDYYYPERVKYSIEMMKKHPKYLIAGCNKLYVHFNNLKKIYSFGPYFNNHCTAASFCFKKELLNKCRFDETKKFGEEKSFLKDYTIPILHLDPFKILLVINHNDNTCDKLRLLNNKNNNKFIKEEEKLNINLLIKNEDIINFYTNVNEKITNNKKNKKVLYYRDPEGLDKALSYEDLFDLFVTMKTRIEEFEKIEKELKNKEKE